MTTRAIHTRRIVISALFLSIALVLRTFAMTYVPLFGESGMRISVHGIFSIMPSILFGPVYGAMVSGLTDMLGHFIRPDGGWLPQLSLAAAAGGFVRGWLWILLKKQNPHIMRGILAGAGALLVIVGAYHMYALRVDGITGDFYRHTDERREAWANRQADEYGTYWEISSIRTEHTNPGGETYWRVTEAVTVIGNVPPGTHFPEPIGDTRPERAWWRMDGTRVIVERLNSEGNISRSVDAGASSVDFTWPLRHGISRMAITRSFSTMGQTSILGNEFIPFMTGAMMGSGGFLLLLLLLDILVRKFLLKNKPPVQTLALVLAMMIPAILVSTFNTWVFRQTIYTSWQLLPFAVVWLPRVLQSMATTTLNVFFVALLIGLCKQQPAVRGLLRE